jgi:diguanylate cyclase (GGDEF)-like protein
MMASPTPLAPSPTEAASRLVYLNEQAWELKSRDARKAEGFADEAIALAQGLQDKAGLAEALLARGYARFKLSQLSEAKEDAEAARELFEVLGNSPQLLETLNLLGIIYGETGELEEALETFLSNYKLCTELSHRFKASVALNNAAIVYNFLGDYASALEFYLKALELCKTLDYREGIARALKNIGVTHFELKHFREALEYSQEALTFQELKADPQLYSYTLADVGRCHKALGNLDEALSYVSQGLRLAEELENRTGVASALDDLGALYLELGNLQEAQHYLDRALWMKRDLNEPLGQMSTQLFRSTLFMKQDKPDLALNVLTEALELARETGSKTELYQSHLALAEACEKISDLAGALAHYKAYLQVKEEVFNESSSRVLQSLRVTAQIERAEQEREIYRLKNVELAQVNEQLQRLDAQKTQLLAQLERQAQEDALTGLFNRRYFDAQLKLVFERAVAHDTPLSVMMCDVDNFKRINDTFSHQVGDKVLSTIASLLREKIRQGDVLARYGGEEFILLMPGTPKEAALQVCERLRQHVADYPWHTLQPELEVTLSLGVASGLALGNPEKLTALADERLYEAKRLGKNRVQG